MASEAWKSFPSKAGEVDDLWHDADDHMVAAAVCARVDELSSAYRRRYDRVQDYYCLYGDPHGKSYETSPVHRNFRNTFAEVIDSKAAELNQDPVWVKVGIKAVGYRAREQARYWEWYAEAAFDRFSLPRLQYVATRDSGLANFAAVVICDEPEGPVPMRVHPMDTFIDDAGCIDIEPPELIIRRAVARQYMIQLVQRDDERTDEEKAKLIGQLRDAPSAKGSNGRDVLELFEAWMHGYPDDPGRHVQAIRGVDMAIVDEEWDGRPPWSYLVLNPPSQGLWRETLADAARLAPIQLERNKLSQRIRDGMHWETPQLLVTTGLIDDEELSNAPGEPVNTSQPPHGNVLLLEPKGVSDSTYGREAALDEYMYHAVKASQDFAQGMEDIKSGTSGRQLKLRRAIANKRLGPEYRQIEEFMERLFRELARGERRAKERLSEYKVTVNVSGMTRDISAGALELDTDTLQVRVKAASSQSLGPEGDFQDLMDMYESGAITNEELWQLAQTGDSEKIRRVRVSGALDEIESLIDLILYDGVLLPPPKHLPPKALEMGTGALMRASVDFREDDGTYTDESQLKLSMMRQWLAKVAENLQPPAPAMPPAPPDVGPAPGAGPPPGPPPGPGPAPPPPGAPPVAPPAGPVITN